MTTTTEVRELWIGRVTIDTNPHAKPPVSRVYENEDERITEATNELRQIGPVDNGIRYLGGSFNSETEARAAVDRYISGIPSR